MKKHFLYSLGLFMSLLTLSSFTDGPDNTNTYINGHEYVDLGLSSGTKWATCNVGASKPEESGGYYAWGETEEKDDYTWETYKWCEGDEYSMTKYCTDSYYGKIDNKTVLEPQDDVAHVKWGGTWRMPTNEEIDELLKECTWEWTNRRGVDGYRVIGPNGKSIFLPFAGCCPGSETFSRGSFGYYWSSSLHCDNCVDAYYLLFSSYEPNWSHTSRGRGQSVRPVCGCTISKQSVNGDKLTGEQAEEEVIYDVAEDPAMFPGGDAALMNFLKKNIKYPRISRDNGSQGIAIVRFVVNTDGSIQNIEVIKSTGDMYLDKEAVRLVEIMPKWTPARQSGKPVRVKYVLPVSFGLQ
jgi:TonB family protein